MAGKTIQCCSSEKNTVNTVFVISAWRRRKLVCSLALSSMNKLKLTQLSNPLRMTDNNDNNNDNKISQLTVHVDKSKPDNAE